MVFQILPQARLYLRINGSRQGNAKHAEDILYEFVGEIHAAIQDKMQIQVRRLINSFKIDHKAILVATLVDPFANYVGLIGGEFILILVAAVPLLLSYYFFSLVVNVVSGCFEDNIVLDEIGPEHGVQSQVVIVDQVILVGSKGKIGLPYLGLTCIYHIVTVHYRASCLLALGFVGQTDKQELFVHQLPAIQNHCFHFADVGLSGDRLLKFVSFEESFAIHNCISLELEGVIMSGFIPAHHRIVVGLSSHVFISPLCILSLVYCKCLGHLFILDFRHFQRIRQIGKFVSVVIVSSFFLYAEVLGL